jgi:SsrA-binding protein
MAPEGVKPLVRNAKARFHYYLEDTFEAGMVLVGSEVKSLRAGRASLAEAYAEMRNGEVFLVNSHINEYPQAGPFNNHPPIRDRKLLLNRKEIDRIDTRVSQRGMTLVPVSIYLKKGRIKCELALGRGKELRDKRETVKRREVEREMRAAISRKRR